MLKVKFDITSILRAVILFYNFLKLDNEKHYEIFLKENIYLKFLDTPT